MIEIKIVEDCPHTVTSGQIHLPHRLIAALAGAVRDKQEWMALLKGTRRPDGMIISVTGFKVPDHYRSVGNVELMRREPLTSDIVGVVHSHHDFIAKFSHTDRTELNTRFPVSIVIAKPRQSSSDEFYSLGFDYAAEGKVTLPCGSVGQINFFVVPTPVPANWVPIRPANFENPNTNSLGDCGSKRTRRTKVHEEIKTECGLMFTRALPAIFGDEDNLIMPQVLKRGRPDSPQVVVQGNQYFPWFSRKDKGGKQASLLGWSEDSRQPNGDQWGYWGVDGKYHRYDDYNGA